MSLGPWRIAPEPSPVGGNAAWLEALLARNAHCAYLRRYGSPRNVAEFRERVPVAAYEDFADDIDTIVAVASDVLFAGRPVAFELTGGSSGGQKRIPFTAEGLADIRRSVLPWLAHTLARHRIDGKVYFALSPAARRATTLGGVPLGLPDGAYLGEAAGAELLQRSAVPLGLAALTDVAEWRAQTRAHLLACRDLQLISVWSPTFLLGLLEPEDDPVHLWPDLRAISCWANASAAPYAAQLGQRFPHAQIEPKGLLATEGVVTVPDAQLRPCLTPHGWFEFAREGEVFDTDALALNVEYEVLTTTASGLYRYLTGDRVQCTGRGEAGEPVLEFVGRDGLASDLVGEKLTDAFVARSLAEAGLGACTLVANALRPGYVAVSAQRVDETALAALERALARNPQYAYARALSQLAPLWVLYHPAPMKVVERVLQNRGVRLADIKPSALRAGAEWLPLFEEQSA